MPVRISFIGAGSYGFTYKLVADILYIEALADCEFVFMDIDEQRLENLKTILSCYFPKVGYNKKATYTTDRADALRGADFVVNLVKIGLMEACHYDMELPQKFGLYQTIGDTSGLGGIFRGIRTMIFDIKLCREMEELSADGAVVLNYTNPQATSVMAVSNVSHIPFIGLCHSVQGTTRNMARLLNVPYERVNFDAAGINHMSWILKYEVDGEDYYPKLKEIVKERGIFFEDESDETIVTPFGPVRLDMLNRTGYMVTESSHHFAEYVPFYLRTGELREKYKLPINRYVRNVAKKERMYGDLVRKALSNELPHQKKSFEYGSRIIESMVTNKPCKIYANVMNEGIITNLPTNSAVEAACLVDKNGVQPCNFGKLPAHLAMLCNMEINSHQMVVHAVLENDKDYILYALMADPATHSVLDLDQMREIAYELIEMEKKYLDGYFA
ncbi:MAG: alpha-glucosidase/alpha-galactosidase [Firmicutes bacterium]|nr:alpha-glucosidase/alpha-galactosidase [Bacillota bacterium]